MGHLKRKLSRLSLSREERRTAAQGASRMAMVRHSKISSSLLGCKTTQRGINIKHHQQECCMSGAFVGMLAGIAALPVAPIAIPIGFAIGAAVGGLLGGNHHYHHQNLHNSCSDVMQCDSHS